MKPDGTGTDRVRFRLDRWKRNLVDLTRRRALLNYRFSSRSRSKVPITGEIPHQVLGQLIEGASFSFDPKPEPEEDDEEGDSETAGGPDKSEQATFWLADTEGNVTRADYGGETEDDEESGPSLESGQELRVSYDPESLAEHHTDQRLQTPLTEQRLDKNLLHIHRRATSMIEEQGVNSLFLALGMLEWYEDVHSDEMNRAPLLLVPVMLERDSARAAFHLSIHEDEPALNPALRIRLKRDFELADLARDHLASLLDRAETEQREQRFRRRLEAVVTFFGRAFVVEEFCPSDLSRYHGARRRGEIDCRGNRVPEGDRREVSRDTASKDLQVLRQVCLWATRARGEDNRFLLDHDPTRDYDLPWNADPRQPIVSDDLLAGLRAEAPKVTVMIKQATRDEEAKVVPTPLPALIGVANGTGRRINALVHLRWGDWHPEAATYGALTFRGEWDKLGRTTTVPVREEVREALRTLRARRPDILPDEAWGCSPPRPCRRRRSTPTSLSVGSRKRSGPPGATTRRGLAGMPSAAAGRTRCGTARPGPWRPSGGGRIPT